jgi:hypothetical protein
MVECPAHQISDEAARQLTACRKDVDGRCDCGHIRSALGADAPRPPTARVAFALSERGGVV